MQVSLPMWEGVQWPDHQSKLEHLHNLGQQGFFRSFHGCSNWIWSLWSPAGCRSRVQLGKANSWRSGVTRVIVVGCPDNETMMIMGGLNAMIWCNCSMLANPIQASPLNYPGVHWMRIGHSFQHNVIRKPIFSFIIITIIFTLQISWIGCRLFEFKIFWSLSRGVEARSFCGKMLNLYGGLLLSALLDCNALDRIYKLLLVRQKSASPSMIHLLRNDSMTWYGGDPSKKKRKIQFWVFKCTNTYPQGSITDQKMTGETP